MNIPKIIKVISPRIKVLYDQSELLKLLLKGDSQTDIIHDIQINKKTIDNNKLVKPLLKKGQLYKRKVISDKNIKDFMVLGEEIAKIWLLEDGVINMLNTITFSPNTDVDIWFKPYQLRVKKMKNESKVVLLRNLDATNQVVHDIMGVASGVVPINSMQTIANIAPHQAGNRELEFMAKAFLIPRLLLRDISKFNPTTFITNSLGRINILIDHLVKPIERHDAKEFNTRIVNLLNKEQFILDKKDKEDNPNKKI